jgi:fluoride ion exporter CrcB/FEX
MLDRGDVGLALAYAGASILAGFLAVALGTSIVRRAQLTW